MTCSTTDPILRLLNRKVEEAKKEMQANLDRQLFGDPQKERSPLGQIIADAVDQHMPMPTYTYGVSANTSGPYWASPAEQTSGTIIPGPQEIMWNQYRSGITENIFKENTTLKHLKEETKMEDTIARDAVRKRKEARAESIVDRVGDYLESSDWVNGDTVSWTCVFPTSDKKYHYVAVKGGNNWYITGDDLKYVTDDLTAKITALALKGTVEFEQWDAL